MDPFDICIEPLGFPARQYIDIILYYLKMVEAASIKSSKQLIGIIIFIY